MNELIELLRPFNISEPARSSTDWIALTAFTVPTLAVIAGLVIASRNPAQNGMMVLSEEKDEKIERLTNEVAQLRAALNKERGL